MTQAEGHWILLDALQFVNNLFLCVRPDEPLPVALRHIFTEVMGKLMMYSGATHGLHILCNTVPGPDASIGIFEIDHLYVDKSVARYLKCALEGRQGAGAVYSRELALPEYARATEGDYHKAKGLQSDVFTLLSRCSTNSVVVQDRRSWSRIMTILNTARRGPDVSLATSTSPLIECNSDKVFVVPLSGLSQKLPAGRLGTLLLWNNGKFDPIQIDNVRGERLSLATKIFSVFIARLLETHYGATSETYLPSFKVPGQRFVAVLFADLRDFTPLTEILRNFGRVRELTKFMVDYCRAMGEIVREHGGRVQRIAGDGIMAVFGEYGLDKVPSVESAVAAARKMCRTFEEMKKQFLASERVQDFLRDEYEPLIFDLGIGINCGPVILDYFGADGNRVYGPLGDHVNFAQRLETQANRFDQALMRRRAPILVSRPVWHLAGRPEWGTVAIEVKGKPYEYGAYEVWPV